MKCDTIKNSIHSLSKISQSILVNNIKFALMPALADSRHIMSLRANLSWIFLGATDSKSPSFVFEH